MPMRPIAFHERIPSVFYPTSVLTVDDSESFLQALEMYLVGTRRPIQFSNPIKAYEDCLHHQKDFPLGHFVDQLDALAAFLADKSRFYQIAVVISDYYMPQMEGPEFLQKVRDSLSYEFKTILLTGATEADMEARLKGLDHIDDVVLKTDIVNSVDVLMDCLFEHEAEFFESRYDGSVECALTATPEFVAKLNRIIAEYGIAEGYLLDKAGTYCLINGKGDAFTLAADSDELTPLGNEFNGKVICPFRKHMM